MLFQLLVLPKSANDQRKGQHVPHTLTFHSCGKIDGDI